METVNQTDSNKEPKHTIKEYDKIEAKIEQLLLDYALVPDCSTNSGFELCKKKYREVRKFETNLENARLAKGQEARDHLKLIATEATRIDNSLKEISAPFKIAADNRKLEIKEEEELAAQKEEKRKQGILDEIAGLEVFCQDASKAVSSNEITGILEAVDNIDVTTNFFEFTQAALQKKADVLERVTELLRSKMAAEELEQMQKEKAAADKAQAVTEAINEAKMIPVDFVGKPASEIEREIKHLDTMGFNIGFFGDRMGEFQEVVGQAILQLTTMLDQQILVEEAKAAADKAAKEEADRMAQEAVDAANEEPAGVLGDLSIEVIEPVVTVLNDFVATVEVEAPKPITLNWVEFTASAGRDSCGLTFHYSNGDFTSHLFTKGSTIPDVINDLETLVGVIREQFNIK